MIPRSATGGSRRPYMPPSWPPAVEPIAIIAAAPHATSLAKMKTTAATAFTSPASTFLTALSRCRCSSSRIPRKAISSTPWAAPK